MEEARRKLRIFLICVVMAAVAVGAIYYFTDVYSGNDVIEGTLVKVIELDDRGIAGQRDLDIEDENSAEHHDLDTEEI